MVSLYPLSPLRLGDRAVQLVGSICRPDKRPQECRYDQLEVTPAYELDRVFGARDRSQPCASASQGS